MVLPAIILPWFKFYEWDWCLGFNIGVTIFLGYQNQNLNIARYGGAKNAVFPKEEISRQYAGYYLNKIWKVGSYLGMKLF